MSSTYDVQIYLLDRANIHDTVTKLPWYYDTRSIHGLADEVFAPEVIIDYTKLMGGEVVKTTKQAWAKQVDGIIGAFDSTQHLYTCLVANLPQPGSGPRPDKCTVYSQAQGNMVKKDARGGPLIENGILCTFEMVRLPELEARGLNPWRVSKQTMEAPAWERGNFAVFTS